jgi:hypothetical protein
MEKFKWYRRLIGGVWSLYQYENGKREWVQSCIWQSGRNGVKTIKQEYYTWPPQ